MFLCVIMKYNYAIKAEMETTMEIQMWKEILTPYDLAVEELQIKFNHIIKEYRQAGVYSPIEQVLGRVKSISSIIEKAQRRGIEIDKIQEKLFDIAGIRLICQFTEDIYTVVKLIKKRKDMTVISEKDYLSLYENKDKRIIWDDNQYLYIAATYLNNHDLNKAKEVIKNRFGKNGLRKKYNEVIKYFENLEE